MFFVDRLKYFKSSLDFPNDVSIQSHFLFYFESVLPNFLSFCFSVLITLTGFSLAPMCVRCFFSPPSLLSAHILALFSPCFLQVYVFEFFLFFCLCLGFRFSVFQFDNKNFDL